MIHLTYTGVLAGQTFCGCERNGVDTFAHANVTALEKPEYREHICPVCLDMWDNPED